MALSGLHLLLTYRCLLECDHCFVWGGPCQHGTMTLAQIRKILDQAAELPTMAWIFFEGGEPFLYYPVLIKAVAESYARGFKVGIVTNAYWAEALEDARLWLQPLAGKVQGLSVSSDLFHYDQELSRQAQNALSAAQDLGMSADWLQAAQPSNGDKDLPSDAAPVMFRGRAAEKLATQAPSRPAVELTSCPYEELADPSRVHVDHLGNLHVCQGIIIGNLFQESLARICRRYNPRQHPVVGPLLAGGPLELARRYGQAIRAGYADACHLCYETRCQLRAKFPQELGPDHMYGGQGDHL